MKTALFLVIHLIVGSVILALALFFLNNTSLGLRIHEIMGMPKYKLIVVVIVTSVYSFIVLSISRFICNFLKLN